MRNPRTVPPDYEVIRAAPEGSSFPGRKALARLNARLPLRVSATMPRPKPLSVAIRYEVPEVPATPERPLPIVYEMRGYAVGATWCELLGQRGSIMQTVRTRHAVPVPRVLEWQETRIGADWYPAQAMRPARTVVHYRGGCMRLVAGEGAEAVIGKAFKATTTPREWFTLARDPVIRHALRYADRVRMLSSGRVTA